MNNKKLIQQYVSTGVKINEYQFAKLSNNFKSSYMVSRINGYRAGDNDLDDWEIDYLPKLPEQLTTKFVEKVPSFALGTRKRLVSNGIDVKIPNMNFELVIPPDEITTYLDTPQDDAFFEGVLSGEWHNDNYDDESYSYVTYSDNNLGRIIDIILNLDSEIGGDDVEIEDMIRAFKDTDHEEAQELINMI